MSILLTREKIEQRIMNFRSVMRDAKLPITPQKLAIFQFLASTQIHPTAQDIYRKMQYYFETISFATVYKNLKKFTDLGLLRVIELRDNTARYDAGLEPHHHLINLDTSEVLDIDPKEVGDIKIPLDAYAYELDSVSVNFFVREKGLSRYERFKATKQGVT